jgi:hypothetical protein
MSSFSGIVPALINIMVIVFIFRVITKAVKKARGDQSSETNSPLNPDRTGGSQPASSYNPTRTFKDTAADIKGAKPMLARKITRVNKEDDTVPQALKRCPGCGGEIPVSMMKCDICGRRQFGAGLPVIIFLVLIFGILIAVLNHSDVSIREFFNQIMTWLSSL